MQTTQNSETLLTVFDVCITWRWSLWNKTCCQQTSHTHNKKPLVVINVIFIYFYFLISPVVKIRKLYM